MHLEQDRSKLVEFPNLLITLLRLSRRENSAIFYITSITDVCFVNLLVGNQIKNKRGRQMFSKSRFSSFILGIMFVTPTWAAVGQNCSDETTSQLVLKAKQEINEREYLTLATANAAAVPWNSPLYTSFDAEYSFYWISEKSSRHSRNIRKNKKSSVVVYNSTVPIFTGFGVYMEGDTVELKNTEEIANGLSLLSERAGFPLPGPENFQGDFRSRLYRFVPKKFWVNTVVPVNGEYVDRRIQITKCMKESA